MAYDSDEEVQALIDMARKLEGVTRNAGKTCGRRSNFSNFNYGFCAAFIAIMKGFTLLPILIKAMWNMLGL